MNICITLSHYFNNNGLLFLFIKSMYNPMNSMEGMGFEPITAVHGIIQFLALAKTLR
jgi:hypothetical protein